nr:immunoglobulin heavy chain junction region [Macaca mulatta]MOW23709.1 immunoglobulin heavy chain junction region [Macaca mulatta]MOW23810.1 immunoglobulin heavy chain junction region [Macaca mulatta]MOW23817.1 immunoglobulin heavy chain junction region [Macaca mulatta]MOW24681.1 immunoglobulin heavy chain junction region [Macaca mulatta]
CLRGRVATVAATSAMPRAFDHW